MSLIGSSKICLKQRHGCTLHWNQGKWILALIVACTTVSTTAYVQQATFHESVKQDDNYHVFKSHVPDSTIYAINKAKRLCVNGQWAFYGTKNYEKFRMGYSRPNGGCGDMNDLAYILSMRYLGPKDTDTDAISLYEGRGFEGQEIYVAHSEYSGISTPIGSLEWAGKSNWTVFEGSNFDGKSFCLKAPNLYDQLYYLEMINFTTVGSVVKGCTEVCIVH